MSANRRYEQIAARVALVTGAGSGIGKCVSLALAGAGYRVVLAGRNMETLEATAKLASENNATCLPVRADVSDEASVEQLFARVEEQFGRLDFLFNNAGVNIRSQPVDEISASDWSSVIATNLTGVFLCAREAIRLMKKQKPSGGRIINNGSISAHVPRPGSAPYTASKHAVSGLTKSINLDCRQFNIACGQIDIGNADTNMATAMKQGTLQANGTLAVEPTIDPERIAEAILYLASLPLDTNVPFFTVMANQMPFFGRG